MPQNRTLLYIGLALGGYLAYRWWENKQAATAPGAPAPVVPPNASTLINPTNIPSSGIIAPRGQTQVPPALAPISTTILPTNSSSIDPQTISVVQKWANTDGRAPVLQMAAAMVPSEYAGMYDLIVNFWDAGVSPDQAHVDFWNNLRTKYDPTHQSW
jgi:hypothetical protein